MIEIIKTDENAVKDKSIVNLPKNVRQIGEVRQDKRIYMEDYVVGFLNSLKAKCEADSGKVCVLMGQLLNDEQGSYNFIRGAILCEEEPEEGESYFSQRLWTAVYKDIDKYFPEYEIVGMAAVFASIDDDLMRTLEKVYIDNFAGRMKALYLVDISEEEDNFYLIEEEQVKRQPGFLQFFERNPRMQEYIVAQRGPVSCEMRQTDSVITNFRSIIQEKQEERNRRKARALVYGVGSFMLVTIMVLGVSLMNNYEKMSQFDEALRNLTKQVNKTDVREVNGNVYPTQSPTQLVMERESNETTENSTEASTQAVTEILTQAETQEATEGLTQEASQASTQPVAGKVSNLYTVKQGDTLANICREMYGNLNNLAEIIRVNEIVDANRIFVGQIIKLP